MIEMKLQKPIAYRPIVYYSLLLGYNNIGLGLFLDPFLVILNHFNFTDPLFDVY